MVDDCYPDGVYAGSYDAPWNDEYRPGQRARDEARWSHFNTKHKQEKASDEYWERRDRERGILGRISVVELPKPPLRHLASLDDCLRDIEASFKIPAVPRRRIGEAP